MQTENRRSFIINFTYFLILAVLTFALLKYALPVLMPFVLAICFAYLLRRPTCFLRKKLQLPNKLSAILVVAAFYLVIGGALALLGIRTFSGAQSLVKNIPIIFKTHIEPVLANVFVSVEQFALQIDPAIFAMVSELDVQLLQSLGDMASGLSMRVMSAASGFATSLPDTFIRIVLLIISTFFIAADYETIVGFCANQLSEKATLVLAEIKHFLIGTLFVCIRSYLIIMSITFVELSIGLTVVGVKNAVVTAALIAIFDILPVLGTGGIMIPWVVISAITGQYSLSLGLLLVYLAVTVIRNIIEPKIVGGQLGLHPVLTLASMFAGLHLLGAVGLFGFPIGLALMRHLNDTGIIHVLKTSETDMPV